MIIYVHILTTSYVVPFDYRPDHYGHFSHLESIRQKLIATNLYSEERLQNMFLPYTNLNPRLKDLKQLQYGITNTISSLIYSPVPYKIKLVSADGRTVTPFFGRQNKQFWLGYLNHYDTIYASLSY
jgi:hypothetical protein